MNYNHPMLLDSSGAREDVASIAVEELNGNNDDLANTTFTNTFEPGSSDVLAEIDSWIRSDSSWCKPSEVLVETPKCGDVSQPHTSHFLPQGRSRSIAFFDDLEINKEVQNYGFCVQGNRKTCPSTLKMVDNVIFTKRMCDILIKVMGAQGGHVVNVQLRYTTGAHENIPVYACKKHSDSIDPLYAFYIPKVPKVEKLDQGGHLTLAVPVSNLPAEEGSFTFPLLFRCWNYCHVEYGKRQELVLTLCDRQNKVLQESHFDVQVCSNPAREFKKYCAMLEEVGQGQESKKHSGEKTKEPAPKRAKQEVEEGGVGMQAGEAGTPTPPSRFPPCQGGRIQGGVGPYPPSPCR